MHRPPLHRHIPHPHHPALPPVQHALHLPHHHDPVVQRLGPVHQRRRVPFPRARPEIHHPAHAAPRVHEPQLLRREELFVRGYVAVGGGEGGWQRGCVEHVEGEGGGEGFPVSGCGGVEGCEAGWGVGCDVAVDAWEGGDLRGVWR